MTMLQRLLGPVVFWLSWPVAYVYLRIGSRSRVLIIVGDSVLLLKGRLGLSEWSLPGGGIHRGEDPAAGAVREVAEEVGIQLAKKQLQALYSATEKAKGLQFDYHCFYAELAKRPVIKRRVVEIAEAAWVPLQDVSPGNASATTCRAVQTWLKR
jgi:8-oxo-dGTP pyrophosphatase MutT (NUDIX family)